MKKLAILILISLFVLVGCQDENSILEPINNIREDVEHELAREDIEEPNWIILPTIDELLKTTEFSVTKFVHEDEDTELIIDRRYIGGIHGEVKIIAKIKFYKGTVKNNTNITMKVDGSNGVVTFTPSQIFNKAAELYIKFEGIDLTNQKREDINFEFIGKDGKTNQIEYKEIIFDNASGTLELKEGKVPHFSRYGWTRTTTTK